MQRSYFPETHDAGSARVARVGVGGACRDTTIRFRRRKSGNKHDIVARSKSSGGGALNVMRGHRLLAPDRRIILLTPLGSDEDGWGLRRGQDDLDIGTPWQPIPFEETSASFILIEAADAQSEILTDAGARAAPVPLDLLQKSLKLAEALCLVHPGVNEQIPEFLEIARRHSVHRHRAGAD